MGPLPGLCLGPDGDLKRSSDPSPTHAPPLTTNPGSAPGVLLYLKDRPFNIGGEGGIFLQFFPTQKKIILFWGKRKFTKKEKM